METKANRDYAKVWWDEQEDMAMVEFSGYVDEKIASEFCEKANKVMDEHKKAKTVFDLRKASRPASSKARKQLVGLAKHPNIYKIAFIGGSIMIRVLAKFIISAAGKGDSMKFFKTLEEGKAWLRK